MTESTSIYRSPDAQAGIADLYRRAREALPFATESRTVPTRFGETHVLLAGPPDGSPIVLFGGGIPRSRDGSSASSPSGWRSTPPCPDAWSVSPSASATC
jgi:hypothetical protein